MISAYSASSSGRSAASAVFPVGILVPQVGKHLGVLALVVPQPVVGVDALAAGRGDLVGALRCERGFIDEGCHKGIMDVTAGARAYVRPFWRAVLEDSALNR